MKTFNIKMCTIFWTSLHVFLIKCAQKQEDWGLQSSEIEKVVSSCNTCGLYLEGISFEFRLRQTTLRISEIFLVPVRKFRNFTLNFDHKSFIPHPSRFICHYLVTWRSKSVLLSRVRILSLQQVVEKIKIHILCFQFVVHELVKIKYNNYDMHEDKIKITYFMFNKHIFFRKSCRLWDNVEKYGTARQDTDANMAHAHCMLDT
jgi:hypothetical protein